MAGASFSPSSGHRSGADRVGIRPPRPRAGGSRLTHPSIAIDRSPSSELEPLRRRGRTFPAGVDPQTCLDSCSEAAGMPGRHVLESLRRTAARHGPSPSRSRAGPGPKISSSRGLASTPSPEASSGCTRTRALRPSREGTDVFLARSADCGLSFDGPVRLSSASSFASTVDFQYGDYQIARRRAARLSTLLGRTTVRRTEAPPTSMSRHEQESPVTAWLARDPDRDDRHADVSHRRRNLDRARRRLRGGEILFRRSGSYFTASGWTDSEDALHDVTATGVARRAHGRAPQRCAHRTGASRDLSGAVRGGTERGPTVCAVGARLDAGLARPPRTGCSR